jgi:hypothetical protein
MTTVAPVHCERDVIPKVERKPWLSQGSGGLGRTDERVGPTPTRGRRQGSLRASAALRVLALRCASSLDHALMRVG